MTSWTALAMANIIWIIPVWMLGMVGYFILPFYAGFVLPPRLRNTVMGHYEKALAWLGDGLLMVFREGGKPELTTYSYDPDTESFKYKLDGEEWTAKDYGDNMSWLHGKPFGLIYEQFDAIVTPRMAEIGRAEADKHEDGAQFVYEGNRPIAACAQVALDVTEKAVDLADVSFLMPGSATPSYATKTEDMVENSQHPFADDPFVNLLKLYIGPMLLTFGLLYASKMFLPKIETGTSEVIEAVPIVLAGLL